MNSRWRLDAALRAATAATAAVCVAILIAVRSGWIALAPVIFASLVALAGLLAAVTFAFAVRRRSAVPMLLCGGLLLMCGGGFANWLFSVQGVALLSELEAIPLQSGTHLQDLEVGALSNLEEMNLTMQLEKVELVRAPHGFLPVSRLRLIERGQPAHVFDISSGRAGALRTLRFHQGAFGYAPRIVITRNGETLFDRHVPFTTTAANPRQLSFDGAFDIQAEHLSVRGAVSLENLDDAMRGHPRLGLTVAKDGRVLGTGELTVGHFARLADGYAVGFAGLKKWSEIDIGRRNYPQPTLAGAALLVAGVLVWPFTLRRKR